MTFEQKLVAILANSELTSSIQYLNNRCASLKETVQKQVQIITKYQIMAEERDEALRRQDEIIRAQIEQINYMQDRATPCTSKSMTDPYQTKEAKDDPEAGADKLEDVIVVVIT